MHRLWHVAVLAVALVGAAGLAIVLLAPLIFEARSAGVERARPAVMALAVAAAVLLLVEWLLVHGRL
jgi:hypothetical protein